MVVLILPPPPHGGEGIPVVCPCVVGLDSSRLCALVLACCALASRGFYEQCYFKCTNKIETNKSR